MQITHDRLKCPFNFASKVSAYPRENVTKNWHGMLGNNKRSSRSASCCMLSYIVTVNDMSFLLLEHLVHSTRSFLDRHESQLSLITLSQPPVQRVRVGGITCIGWLSTEIITMWRGFEIKHINLQRYVFRLIAGESTSCVLIATVDVYLRTSLLEQQS